MENSVAIHDPNVSLGLQKVADGLFKSGMFPNAKNTFGAYAIVQYGHELGIPPMMALKNINIISGQLACNAQLMLSMAMSRGVSYSVIKETDKGADILFKRGEAEYLASFTEDDAKAAGLTGKDNWKKYARDMYFWRAVAKGIRRIAPDAVLGLYTKDEISNGEIIDVTPTVQPTTVEAQDADATTQPAIEPTDDTQNKLNRANTLAQSELKKQDDVPAEPQATHYIKKITKPQAVRFYAIAKGANKEDDQIKAFLKENIGTEHTSDIPVSMYEYLCKEIAA